jgi:hypothetical protein
MPDNIPNQTIKTMFYKFNAHKSAPPKTSTAPGQQVAQKIFHKGIAIQRRWADFIGRQSSTLSPNWLKALSITILFSSCSYCAYLLYDAVTGTDNETHTSDQTPRRADSHRYPQKLDKQAKDSIRNNPPKTR